MGTVYKATFTNGKAYVGFTSNTLEKRMNEHYHDARNGRGYLFHDAIRKHGWDSLEWSVLYESDDVDELKDQEMLFIEKERTYVTEDGYNLTKGGEGGDNTAWFASLTEEEYRAFCEQAALNGQKGKGISKPSWKNDTKRLKEHSIRMKERWKNDDGSLSKKMSETRRKKYAALPVLEKEKRKTQANIAAKMGGEKVKGTKWYKNDKGERMRCLPGDKRLLNGAWVLGR
jgi:group I intron endonuclease